MEWLENKVIIPLSITLIGYTDMPLDYPIDFIKSLKSEHRSIIATICDIENQSGGPGNLQSSIEKLNRTTDILFSHLEKEDKILYPVLMGSTETRKLAKKYSYDMERLSCIALDFFKRYCINKEGLRIFIEDFINGYSLFSGLLKMRIKREEMELYPSFILLESGVLSSEVLQYVQEKETLKSDNEKRILIFGKDEPYLKALELALEICGLKVYSTNSLTEITSISETTKPDLILLDITKSNKELRDLVVHLKEQVKNSVQLFGYSTSESYPIEEKIEKSLDAFIPQVAINMETLSEKVKKVLS